MNKKYVAAGLAAGAAAAGVAYMYWHHRNADQSMELPELPKAPKMKAG